MWSGRAKGETCRQKKKREEKNRRKKGTKHTHEFCAVSFYTHLKGRYVVFFNEIRTQNLNYNINEVVN